MFCELTTFIDFCNLTFFSWIYWQLCWEDRRWTIWTKSYRLRLYLIGFGTGKSLSEVLIYLSINPQYDNSLFNELQVQYEKITRAEHVKNMSRTCQKHVKNMSRTCCLHKLFWMPKQKIWELEQSKYSLGIAELNKILSKAI